VCETLRNILYEQDKTKTNIQPQCEAAAKLVQHIHFLNKKKKTILPANG